MTTRLSCSSLMLTSLAAWAQAASGYWSRAWNWLFLVNTMIRSTVPNFEKICTAENIITAASVLSHMRRHGGHSPGRERLVRRGRAGSPPPPSAPSLMPPHKEPCERHRRPGELPGPSESRSTASVTNPEIRWSALILSLLRNDVGGRHVSVQIKVCLNTSRRSKTSPKTHTTSIFPHMAEHRAASAGQEVGCKERTKRPVNLSCPSGAALCSRRLRCTSRVRAEEHVSGATGTPYLLVGRVVGLELLVVGELNVDGLVSDDGHHRGIIAHHVAGGVLAVHLQEGLDTWTRRGQQTPRSHARFSNSAAPGFWFSASAGWTHFQKAGRG